MKQTRMFSHLLAIFICFFWISTGYAAQIYTLWGPIDKHASQLKQFSIHNPKSFPAGLQTPKTIKTQTPHTLTYLKGQTDSQQISHVRYAQYYKGVPVWGMQLIYHLSATAEPNVTGKLALNIDDSVHSINEQLSVADAIKIVTAIIPTTHNVNTQQIIYIDEANASRAVLAYLITYMAKTRNGTAFPHFIVDANNGAILSQWDGMQYLDKGQEASKMKGMDPAVKPREFGLNFNSVSIGQGPGGVTFNNLSYRPGNYQFGPFFPGIYALGKFSVTIEGTQCVISNPLYQLFNLENVTLDDLPFEPPVSTYEKTAFGLTPFSYFCTAPDYLNDTDNGFSPINQGLSPINDVNYFVEQSYNMYTTQYGIGAPIGVDLPVQIYTHVGDYENAWACGTHCMQESGIIAPQQLLFGNGDMYFAPLTDATVTGHEFAHLVTDHCSNLIYNGQSGGLNESFSDMSAIALENYINLTYPWFWSYQDWTIGLSITKNGLPLRYLYNPPLDGVSIDNAAQYRPGMNVHYSSGVFNKAFYLLSNTPGWSVSKAFEIMLDANINYWTPDTNFNYAACGVMQSAYNRGYAVQAVVSAFQQVGVTCLVG